MVVPSPCVRNCCLDEKDVCLGCYRTVEEIIRWGDASEEEKIQILHDAENRKMENNSRSDFSHERNITDRK